MKRLTETLRKVRRERVFVTRDFEVGVGKENNGHKGAETKEEEEEEAEGASPLQSMSYQLAGQTLEHLIICCKGGRG